MIIILYYIGALLIIIFSLNVKINCQTYILSSKYTQRATVVFFFVLLRFNYFTFYLSSLLPIAARCMKISSDKHAILNNKNK